jgi:c(7)-type cytochrome triheme protein
MRRSALWNCAAVILLLPIAVLAKVGGGDVEYDPKGAGKVLFQHEYHVNIKGTKCNNCHHQPFKMSGGAPYKMDMKLLTKGEFCGLCHDGKKAFDVIARDNCGKCHK